MSFESKNTNTARVLNLLAAFISILIVFTAFTLSSQIGGMLQISYENYLLFFNNRYIFMFLAFFLLAYFLYTNHKYSFYSKKSSIIFTLVVVGFAVLARVYLPIISFSTYQNKADYYSIEEASKVLDEMGIEAEDREMIVIEHNGHVKAFSNKAAFLPHLVSGDYGDDHIIMAYCVLSSLPIAFNEKLNGEAMDISVLLAPMNNLLMYDHTSGELIRQLELKTVTSQTPLDLIPVQKMPWSSYKKLYPKGEVFLPLNPNIFQKLMSMAIGDTIDPIIEGEELFYKPQHYVNPKLPDTERVWGILVGDSPIAITKDYLQKNKLISMQLGGRNLVLAYFEEYDTVGAFYNDDNLEVTLDNLDPYGNVGDIKLPRVEGLYNTVFWAPWAFFYPHTELLDVSQ